MLVRQDEDKMVVSAQKYIEGLLRKLVSIRNQNAGLALNVAIPLRRTERS